MFVREVRVRNRVGLHAKPASNFIRKANMYRSLIWISKGDIVVNAKSLLGVLSLGIMGGIVVKISADGIDEEQAVEALVDELQRDTI